MGWLKDKARGGNLNGGTEHFEQMRRAVALLRQVIMQAVENKPDRENTLDHIREVLGGFRQLRRTEHVGTINSFLIP